MYNFFINLYNKKVKIIAYKRETTACFTGHRTYDGSRNEELKAAVRELYVRGYRTFLCGMAMGFDLAAAECALSLRNELKGLRIVSVVPFGDMQRKFSIEQQALYNHIITEADEVITLATNYSANVYALRNNYLVDNSSAVIAYFTGAKGGTAYTVRRAVKSLSLIVNIYNNPQQKLSF
ncbi:MAG: DUF1273 domain-containing protein [Rikenellaceae bacterium]|nr:DUF1273 domain-containing protein [Rikenellaceae bacterium]